MKLRHDNLIMDRADGPGRSLDVAPRDLLMWRDMVLEVVDVAQLDPDYCQVVARRLDRPALPISLSAADLEGALVWQHAGVVRELEPAS
jgi:hypothetical protein